MAGLRPLDCSALCKRCGSSFGKFWNSWKQVTGSYYLQTDLRDPWRRLGISPKGVAKAASPTYDELRGCILQPLACDSCGEVVAFRCINAPEAKAPYLQRDFYKLSKLSLVSGEARQEVKPVEPVLESTLLLQDLPDERLLQQINTGIIPKPLQRAINKTLPNADKAAVSGTNDGSLDWQEAHENWARDSGRSLSPRSFALRVMSKGGGRLLKGAGVNKHAQSTPPEPSRIQPTSALPQLQPRPQVNAAIPQQIQPSPKKEVSMTNLSPSDRNNNNAETSSRPQQYDVSASQERWQDQGSGIPNPQLHNQITHQSFSPQGQYMLQRPPQLKPSPRHTAPPPPAPAQQGQSAQSPIDRQNSSIERLQSDVAQMQRSLWDMSGALAEIRETLARGGPPLNHSKLREDAMDLLSETVVGMAAKTGKIDSIVVQMDTLKRKINRLELQNGNVSGTPPLQWQKSLATSPPVTTSEPLTQITGNPENDLEVASGLKRNAPSNTERTASKRFRTTDAARSMTWHSLQEADGYSTPTAIAPMNQAVTGVNGEAGYPPQGGWSYQQPTTGLNGGALSWQQGGSRGRPRKHYYMPDYRGARAEDSDGNWTESPGPLEFQESINGRGNPLSTDRGRIVRRGRGGGASKTGKRVKPFRNEEGFLIRPNGTIDRRSITSKQNLARYQKKKEEETMQRITSSQAGGPTINASPSDRPVQQHDWKAADLPSERPTEQNRIMKQMFPKGIASDADRMNHAAHLFSTKSPEKAKMLPRHEMQKDDAAEHTFRSQQDSETQATTIIENGSSRKHKAPQHFTADTQHFTADTGSSYVPSTKVTGSAPFDKNPHNHKNLSSLLQLTDDANESSKVATNRPTTNKRSKLREGVAEAPSPEAWTSLEEEDVVDVPDSDASALQSRRPSTGVGAVLPEPGENAQVVKDSQASYYPSAVEMETQSQI